MPALHRPDEIFSRRHLPTWIMLTFAAGCVNAIAMVACAHFVTHVTGTVTKLGTEIADLSYLMEFAGALACFIGGAMVSGMLINARAHRGQRPLYAAPLVVVAATTAAVALAGHAGLLGMFGGDVLDAGDFVLMSVLSFASGLQNAAVATSTGLLVRTTHLTGPATDLGIHLVEFAYAEGDVKRSAKRHALLRAGKIVAFAVGAAAGVTLAHGLHFLAFLVPASMVLLATALSFLRVPTAEGSMMRSPSPSVAAL
ncbi:YoaK family protein [Sorangium sp. So ce1389]|uniref:YoaK family protein n=1 Tax=Sorangium sp. So ce1389 TaxID=3133336 RepID=UPI003F5D756D